MTARGRLAPAAVAPVTAAHRVAAVRAAEEAAAAQLPGGLDALMDRAAAALAAVVARELRDRGGVYGARVALLVGGGRNGGDALLAGALLAGRGAAVVALLATRHPHAASAERARAAGVRLLDAAGDPAGADPPDRALAAADVVVDGLLGTGGRPGLSGAPERLVQGLPAGALVVAVDLPSGVAADTGETSGTHVRADVTVTFGTAKPALLLPPARAAAGRVVVADIGLGPVRGGGPLGAPDVEQLSAQDAADRWPVPGPEADKYSRGVLGVVAGGSTYTGAALLCTTAAVRAGAGMVRYVGPARPTELVRQRLPEVVPGAGRVQAWVAGPGVDPDDDAQAGPVRDALDAAVGDGVPVALDAGALPALVDHVGDAGPLDPHRTRVLLTPHAGELARLLTSLGAEAERSAVEAAPLVHARRAAELTGAVVLLKGATTLVVHPDGRVRAQTDGPGWLGTAGAGDVLAGVVGTLLAAGLAPLDAGSLATAVHGRAAVVASGGGPLHAAAVAEAVPGVVARLLTARAWS